MTRPASFIDWATDVGAVDTEPSAGLKGSGWLAGDVVADGHLNWVLQRLDEWTQHHDDATNDLNLIRWQEKPNPSNIQLNDVTYDIVNARWCAVGNAAGTYPYIITSDDDGDTWTLRTPTVAKNLALNSIAHNGVDLWVAVGEDDGTDSYILSSPDGETWTQRIPTTHRTADLRGVAHDQSGLWTAVGSPQGSYPLIVTSTDGITWTERVSNGLNTQILFSVAHDGDALWTCVGGHNGTQSLIQTSADGITWTVRNPPTLRTILLRGIAHDQTGIWVASGDTIGTNDPYILYSYNGTTWFEGAASFGGAMQAVFFGGGECVLCSSFITSLASKDGRLSWLSFAPDTSRAAAPFGGGYGNHVRILVGGADGTDADIYTNKL